MNEIQESILDIYKQIKRICDKNNLLFYAIGGTCIGAVRHQGFIPWDDDMDIAVPIECWDEFWDCMKKELPSDYEIYTCNEVKHYRYIFNKIHNAKTTFIEEAEVGYPDAYKGIYVDVMPIAGMPAEQELRAKFINKIQMYAKLNFVRRYPFREMKTPKSRFAWILLHLLSPFLSYHYFSDKWLEMLKRYPLKKARYTGYTWWDSITNKLCFPIEYFETTIELPFEDSTISCPVQSKDYLSSQFGNYMELPPEDQRLDHHQVCVSTNKSYKEYKKEF